MTYYALSTFKQTLSNSGRGAFGKLKNAFSDIHSKISIFKRKHLSSISIHIREKLSQHFGKQGWHPGPSCLAPDLLMTFALF